MKKKALIPIFFLSTILLINAWLPSDTKTKILSPLSDTLKEINNLEISVRTVSPKIDGLKSSAANIPVSDIRDIKPLDIKQDIAMLYEKLLEADPLLEKGQYLSGLSDFRTKMDITHYSQCEKIIEQLYSYKTTHNNLNTLVSQYQNSTGSMNARISKSIQVSENYLKESRSNPNIDAETTKKHEMQFSNLKSKLLWKTNMISVLQKTLESKRPALANIQKGLLAGLGIKPPEGTKPPEDTDIAGVPDKTGTSVKDLKNFHAKANRIMELSRSLLSKDMQRAIKHLKNNEVEKAGEIFRQEISKNPGNWMARKYLAKVLIKNNKLDEAIKEINRALQEFKKEMGME